MLSLMTLLPSQLKSVQFHCSRGAQPEDERVSTSPFISTRPAMEHSSGAPTEGALKPFKFVLGSGYALAVNQL